MQPCSLRSLILPKNSPGVDAGFIALRDRHVAETDGDGIALGPEGEFAGLHNYIASFQDTFAR